ncbi:polyribonucleotide nucleotidyltransferase [Desulfonauticus submarinus]|uniref:Polyribonucleotide nucleotidyltransferase n=1 Tax=Desulfonauticus submarinus TaxID=206665 RepID=A0A1H0ALC6_9BACT|nr:polyribonucleotide nucleotidyltransferase [Desulfonauticus submarinus]SDN34235.1 polyribonucleotide nucleotidyltransferase [Desulfonauticus submarinus]
MSTVKVSAPYGEQEIILEYGRLALQANGAIWAQWGDTVVLVTAVGQKIEHRPDFMPLTVNYQEMSYAAGRIPGGYFRREIGRPSERETLVSRLIDRPIRPLFPKGLTHEVQIIATVLSADTIHDPDILAMTGASAALTISEIPFLGPIAGIRVGYINEEFILNPNAEQLKQSTLNLVMACTDKGVVMVEGGASFVPEELLAEAIEWGQKQAIPILEAQKELQEKCGQPKIEFNPPEVPQDFKQQVKELVYNKLEQALNIPEKLKRKQAKKEVKEEIKTSLSEILTESPEYEAYLSEVLEELEKEIVRKKIVQTQTRIDGRDLTTVRPLNIEVGILPRTHGSAIFARGETKVLSIATLGSTSDEQRVETLAGDSSKRFMLHYNFPPYCVGEVKPLRGPSRREIGHGALAERALTPVLPSEEEFPFTLRIVSEVMESNGSSSMATVCGGSLALMDAGVPIKDHVAGIAMGLIKENENYYILTDILGDEDHLGDMDFKVAGTITGVTAIQMDLKITGIPSEIMKKALLQAREARLHILDTMKKVLAKPRTEVSPYAPKMTTIEVAPDRIRDIIGPMGKTIKAITAATNATIDIEESGKITIFAPNKEALDKTVEMILYFNQKPELGKNYSGLVKKILDFGAVVEILPGVDGLLHISQLADHKVSNVEDILKVGDTVKVKVVEIDSTGKIRLSKIAVVREENGEKIDLKDYAQPKPRQHSGKGHRSSGGKRNFNRGNQR